VVAQISGNGGKPDDSGCRVWKPYSSDEYDTKKILSEDGKFEVTVVVGKELRGWKYAVQIRVHCEGPAVPDKIYSWPEGDYPGSAWYPIFTDVLEMGENLYLLLGWEWAGAGGESKMHAWVVKLEAKGMRIAEVSYWANDALANMKLAVQSRPEPRLGLLLPNDEPDRTFRFGASVLDELITHEKLQAESQPAMFGEGKWYSWGDWVSGKSEPDARIYWISLKQLVGTR
jgi:hypothetical protein